MRSLFHALLPLRISCLWFGRLIGGLEEGIVGWFFSAVEPTEGQDFKLLVAAIDLAGADQGSLGGVGLNDMVGMGNQDAVLHNEYGGIAASPVV